MILVIDIGNTNIVLGCYDGDKVVFRERVSSTQKATDLEYAVSIKTALEMNRISLDGVSGVIM